MIVPSFTMVWRDAAVVLSRDAIPPSPRGDPRSQPNAASGYIDALARASLTIAADDTVAVSGAASMLGDHGDRQPRAFALAHGITRRRAP